MLPFNEESKDQFNIKESILLTILNGLFAGQQLDGGPFNGWNSMFTKSFGISPKTVSKKFDGLIDGELSIARKTRSDKGWSVSNCKEKRKGTFTALNLNIYKKMIHLEKALQEFLKRKLLKNIMPYLKQELILLK